nr:PREDICTED: bromodomain adjacent to zinc finger domain protein 2B isoform X4 [Lepisosteus oculatus]XP_015214188.1 PREDICTED: bromodomain adjacent to zinc finger domain protein 2B isoform X4 [Lepisosteus oculatus]XP_015214189.1 PREDICTED: bromodomain adjacent to zinc finger domain protein 2B isoform X4 [Lepisosteus oculatus]XP_015214190.1 PREDICTED: bromodomain adjacent to zinc finger domain protein 2B isoform X4 [Lepisosteus oculatus]
MESGERLASPSAASSSVHTASSTASSPTPSKSSLATGPTALSSTLATCGHLFRAAGDQSFNLSTVSSAFPMVNHPAFGLYTTSSGRSEFGGLGTLGASAALATHPQLGTFPEWWRTEAHSRGGATFFPPLLGIPSMFASPVPNHDSSSFQSRTASKNARGGQKGVNGAVNGSSITTSTGANTATTTASALASSGQTKAAHPSGRSRKSNPEQNSSQLQEKTGEKSKDKKLRKKPVESSSNSDSESGSSSDTSSEGVSSSDSEDLEEDDDDDEEDDDDQTNEESEDDSDSESETRVKGKTKVLMQNLNEVKKDGQKPAEEKEPQDKTSNPPRNFTADPPTPPSFQPQQAQPQVLSQQSPLVFQSSQAKEEAMKKHLSVIHSTGLAASNKPLALVTQPRREASPKPVIPSPDVLKAGNRSTAEEPCSQISDLRLKQEQFKQTFPVQLKKQQELYKIQKKLVAPVLTPKITRDSPSNQKLANSNHSNLFLSNTLLGHHQPNGVIQSAIQEAPLALTTKPRSQTKTPDKPLLTSSAVSFSAPVNLSTGGKNHSTTQMVPVRPSTSPALPHVSGKDKASSAKVTPTGKSSTQSHLVQSLVDLFRGAESDIPSSKDSDDSAEDEDDEDDDDDEEDDEDEEDTDDSQSESESNFESDSDGSEDDEKDHDETETDTEGEKTPLKLNKSAPAVLNASANCTPLNLQVIKSPNLSPTLVTSTGTPAYHSTPSSSFSISTPPGSGKRRRVTDERELRIPLEYGWQRETRIRNFSGRLQGEVAYYAPCGKKLRQYPEVVKYLTRNGITDITRDNFSFSAKIRVGDFYEARDGPQGMQWTLLKEEEVIPRIRAMEGRRGRPPNPERQRSGDGSRTKRRKGRPPNVGATEFPSPADAKLLRKLEAQEIARQAAQIKLMRKLEKQALARAAKEARKQQAIMAAEEKRKQKEQIKILKQQEKIKRIQQIRMEKELRAQQILEAKRKKKEEAANAKILEAEKRTKEKEMRRQQAVLLKHQELERHRLDMVWERERRRQHMMLMKAMEARKKAEEKERLKQEKRDEKRLNKERKLELRRLELEIAKEMKKPNEDMCLADHKPLPELSRIPGLVLPGSTFSDCLMVVQFLRNFGKVLGFDISVDVPSLSVLQEGLLNVGDSMGEVQDLLVRLLSAVVCDPGLPPGHRAKTALGDHLTNVGINRDNVSEILQIYMEAHCVQTELTESLKTKAFQSHTPAQKASVLAFLVNELACSKSVVSEIDKNIDHMSNLRRDKWVVEGKLRKLRIIHAKKTGKRDSSTGGEGGEEQQALGTPSAGRKRKRKGGDSDEDEDEDEDSEDQGEDDDEDEDDKKGKKAETCEEEDDGDQAATVEELEKQIEKLTKQQSQFRRKLFEASHSLRSMMFGQDRYKRRYWVLPQCGGIFVEAMESGEGPEELEKERERLKNAETIQIKEEVTEEKPLDINLDLSFSSAVGQEEGKDTDNPNLFLQKPGSFSKLSKLLEVAKMSPESDALNQKQNGSSPANIPAIISSPTHSNSQQVLPSPQPAASQCCPDSKPDSNANLFSPIHGSPGKMYNSQILPNDQLFRVLTERSGHWFSLLPRTPCDDSSLTSTTTPSAASPHLSSMRPKSPSPSPTPPAVSASPQNPVGMNNFTLSALQVKPGLHLMSVPFCGWPTGIMSPTLPFSSNHLPPASGPGFGMADGNGNPFLVPSVSTSKSESPVPQNEKLPSAPSPAVEVAKPVDYPSPRPIPEEMLTGWWRITDAEELRALVKVLHFRGIREKALQKQIQKHMDYISQACAKNKDVAIVEINDNEENQVTQETLESWCVEEQAMEMDIAILQQVEELERKVASASLQVKGWIYPEPHSEREDLVYYEHKPFAKEQQEEDSVQGENEDCGDGSIIRRINNPLDIAVTRLAELERNIERRYLKSPLSTTIQIKLDNVGTVTVPAPAPSSSGDGDGGEEDIAPGLKVWRKALSEVRSAAQLALCIQQLQKSIAWEKSIMKVYCQICRKGDNEELLLLCDGCDKGCHTYCHRPKITTIPEGDWFCPACIAKASGQSPRSKKLQNRSGKKNNEVKRSRKLSVAGEVSEDDAASTSSTPKKGSKEAKKRKGEENASSNQSKQESPLCVKKAKTAKDNAKDLAMCSIILSELETHQDAWPFLLPVNSKLVPGYKKVIKKPMDFSTIREKLGSSQYQNLEAFIVDVKLVFDNCETFNEDDSEIGRAGHNMRRFFERRWTEICKSN